MQTDKISRPETLLSQDLMDNLQVLEMAAPVPSKTHDSLMTLAYLHKHQFKMHHHMYLPLKLM